MNTIRRIDQIGARGVIQTNFAISILFIFIMYYIYYLCCKFQKQEEDMAIKRSILIIALTSVLWTAAHSEAYAQRTAEGSIFIGASQVVSAYSIPSEGMDICAGGYLSNSLWKAGVRAVDWNHHISSDTGADHDELFDNIAWSLYGGWCYRLLCTYNRALSLYLGCDAFIGLNQYEALRKLSDELSTGLPGCEFIYGVCPEAELEIFVSRSVALTLGAQLPVTIGSSLKSDKWNLTGSIGIRINLLKR